MRKIRLGLCAFLVAAALAVVGLGVSAQPAQAASASVTIKVTQAKPHSATATYGGGKVKAGSKSAVTKSLSVKVSGMPAGSGVSCRVHEEGGTWGEWKADGSTAKAGKGIDGIAIKLTGPAASVYDVWYRAWSKQLGWLDWTSSADGTDMTSIIKSVGRVQICLVAKGAKCPYSYSAGWRVKDGKLRYRKADGSFKKSTTYEGVALDSDGFANMGTTAKLKLKCIKILAGITTHDASKSSKLRAVWKYCTSQSRFYYTGKYPSLTTPGWQREHALDMLETRGGNCYSFACAFAALAYEAGYKGKNAPYVVCGRVNGSRDGSRDGLTRHAWVRINGRFYDPEGVFAGWLPSAYAYGAGSYQVRHTIQGTVRFDSNAVVKSKGASSLSKTYRSGLHKVDGKYYCFKNYTVVKSKWVTAKGKRYYFTSDGSAATGAKLIKGTRYVFDKKGRLLKGKGTRVVKVGSSYYRVDKKGRAKKGWNAEHTKYYGKTGRMLCCARIIDGSLFVFGTDGIYDASRTSQARSAVSQLLAAKRAGATTSDMTLLTSVLGNPSKVEYMDSCYVLNRAGGTKVTGQDGLWSYGHISINTFKASDGVEYLVDVSKN